MDILNKIFEVVIVKIAKIEYRLKYTLSSTIYLENKGIKLDNLAKKIQETPQTTIFMLVFAGLPKDKFRENMTFDSWIETLSQKESDEILKKTDVCLAAFFNDMAVEIGSKSKKDDTKDLKKKIQKVVDFVMCRYRLTYEQVGNLTYQEIFEMFNIMIMQDKEDFALSKIADLNNIKAGAYLTMTHKKGQQIGIEAFNKNLKYYKEFLKTDSEIEEEQNPDVGDLLK